MRYNIEIVGSDYYPDIYNGLLSGVNAALSEVGMSIDHVRNHLVFGAYEIPLAVKRIVEKRRADNRVIDGIITLGVVVKGETAHFDYICSSVYQSLSSVQLEMGIPVAAGILTVFDLQQALARSLPVENIDGAPLATQQPTSPAHESHSASQKSMRNKGLEAGRAVISAIDVARNA